MTELEFPREAADDARSVSLADEAYLALRERIVTCQIFPGQRVTERQLAADLKLGLTPVRQALVRLSGEGLVRTLPRRGYQIEPLTIGSVNELFEVWRIIGPAIVELAARNVPPDVRESAFAGHAAEFLAAWDRGDAPAALERTRQHWLWLAEATRNRRLMEIYRRLEGELRRVSTVVFGNPAARRAIWPHEDGAQPPATPEAFRRACETYIDTAHHYILSILTSWPSVVHAEVVPLFDEAAPTTRRKSRANT
jgi:DNA-binding GntR family transcriptional regulator